MIAELLILLKEREWARQAMIDTRSLCPQRGGRQVGDEYRGALQEQVTGVGLGRMARWPTPRSGAGSAGSQGCASGNRRLTRTCGI